MEGGGTIVKEVWITEAATVTPLGDDLKGLWKGLLAGQSSIKPVQRFAVKNYHAGIASCMEDLSSHHEKSLAHTLMERLINPIASVPADALLITASTKAGIDNLERLTRGIQVDPRDVFLFRMTDAITDKLGLSKKGMHVSAACASSTIATVQGASLIAAGYTDVVLICCLDLVTEFVFSGFSSLHVLSPFPCRPFDRHRDGMSLGEGGAVLLLMSKDRCLQENRKAIGGIYGWGAANDASHITSPARDGCGLVRAIRQALKKARLNPEDIGAVSAHGTGTVYNDLMELNAFSGMFKDRQIPIYSIKGAIGHTLGAAGGIEIAIGLLTLSAQMVPPTVGFSIPEKGADGKVSGDPVRIRGDYLLTTNSGFGGINAALVLGKVDA